MSNFSTPEQLEQIRTILSRYIRLPFSKETIPGAIMEAVLGHLRDGNILDTYDFVDVVSRNEPFGWQIKSTKSTTPVTWKRAKIPNALSLIQESQNSAEGLQALGDAIIDFCNAHALESMELYNLDEIGYCRLVIHSEKRVTYFERLLCTPSEPNIFMKQDFEWRWSTPKNTVKKEQLRALHGIHRATGEKWWAWHGLGENQLHFSGEKAWWPSEEDAHAVAFDFPSDEERVSLDKLMELLSTLDIPS